MFTDTFIKIVESILTVDKFQLQSSAAIATKQIATAVIQWSKEGLHMNQLAIFAEHLESELRSCCDAKSSSGTLKKEKLWGLYHQKRTSKLFNDSWIQFLKGSVEVEVHPAFYQYVTQEMFTKIIEEAFPVGPSSSKSTLSSDRCTCSGGSLNYVEQNAVRYIAGYTCRKLRDKICSSSEPSKDTMMQCLSEMAGEDDSDVNLSSEDWISMLDRGGLWLVNDQTYTLFAMMEEIIQTKWTKANIDAQGEGAKQGVIDAILQNEDILFQWCFCCGGLDMENNLLTKIVELFVTIRGFASASSCLELYKQAHQRTLQKKKALRKTLCDS